MGSNPSPATSQQSIWRSAMNDEEIEKIKTKLQMVDSIVEANRTKSDSFIFQWYQKDINYLLGLLEKK